MLPRLLTVTAVVLALLVTPAAAGQRPNSGIAARVNAAPTCPVEMVPPQPACAPRPLAARVRIRELGGRRITIVVRADGHGRFRVRLAPATYILRALPVGRAGLPRPPAPFEVRVPPHRFARVTITYDTGIR